MSVADKGNYRLTPGARRANEQVREQIANILLFEVSDPELSFVTITGCDVSPDKRNAKVYYTTSKDKYEKVSASFEKAKGYIRKLLGNNLSWRVVPVLNFHLDPSVDMGETIAKAFEKEESR